MPFSVKQPEYVFTPATIQLNEDFLPAYNDLNSPEAQDIMDKLEEEVNCPTLIILNI